MPGNTVAALNDVNFSKIRSAIEFDARGARRSWAKEGEEERWGDSIIRLPRNFAARRSVAEAVSFGWGQ